MTAATSSAQVLKHLVATALQCADGERAVCSALLQQPLIGPVRVLALGKAAAAMWRGAARTLGHQVRAALVIAPAVASERDRNAAAVTPQWLLGGHPVPDANSLAAGAAARTFVADCTGDECLLVLLSGGASAMCEVLNDGITLADVQALQQVLLAANLPIDAINAVRQSLSQVKAGGLARCCPPNATVRQLVMSDVPGDDLAVVGSAPFIAAPARSPNLTALPAFWQEWLQQHGQPQPSSAAPAPTVQTVLIASNASVRQALQRLAIQWGLAVVVNQPIAGSCIAVTEQIVSVLQHGPAGLYLFGGECHLHLPDKPGRGGRNQHLALSLAIALADVPGISILSLATDGVDGQSDAAGALFVSGAWPSSSIQYAEASAALASASSYDWWRLRGGLLFTGPTGSNVADLLFCLKS